ncbi:hypothetical protein JST56_04310 [Candidatus Dependentiae bacterium]|jgi:hypothetical protein|nr:hypothetical protein [Candidatus Dependentiae bacterium]
MKKIIKEEIIKIAQVHEKRLSYALKSLVHLIPFTAEKVLNLNEHDFLVVELMTNRFSKLQDFVGSKIINLFLDVSQEPHEALTMIDKLNKLEKFHIIDDKDVWQEMRELRNHLAHEYPDQPELVAQFLNQTYSFSQELLQILSKLLERIG